MLVPNVVVHEKLFIKGRVQFFWTDCNGANIPNGNVHETMKNVEKKSCNSVPQHAI